MNWHWHIGSATRVLRWLLATLLVAAPLGTVLAAESGSRAAATASASDALLRGLYGAGAAVGVPAILVILAGDGLGGFARSGISQDWRPKVVTRAEHVVSKRQLRVDATSTSASGVLSVLVTSSGQLIGTLSNNGAGSFGGQFTWPDNPLNITVRSSLGGSASRAVAAK